MPDLPWLGLDYQKKGLHKHPEYIHIYLLFDELHFAYCMHSQDSFDPTISQ